MEPQFVLQQFFTTLMVVNLLALPIPILLMVQALHRKHKTLEIKIFIQMCIMDLALCLTYAGFS